MLHKAKTELQKLDGILRGKGEDGLDIRFAEHAFRRWIGENGRRLTAVLATKSSSDSAKDTVRRMKPPDALAFSLDPELPDVLAPVVEALEQVGLSADDARALAENPAETLASIGGFGSVGELDAEVEFLLNEAERESVLHAHASEWKREIHFLAVLANVGENETSANIRDMDEKVSSKLPANPASPADLRDFVGGWFGGHSVLKKGLLESLTDSIHAAPPDRGKLMGWARSDGVSDARADSVKRALDKPRVARVRELKEHVERLEGMRPEIPSFIPPSIDKPISSTGEGEEIEPTGERGPRHVPSIKIGKSLDETKRRLGDEGERWALAAVVRDLVDLDNERRDEAINEISRSIRRNFKSTDVEKMLGHGEDARVRGLDEEDLYEALSEFLHASRHSDGFGFDVIGWIERRAVCLEVKSASSEGEGFLLSRGEWNEAERLRGEFAVLVVRRSKGGDPPAGMDLLPDPVKLWKAGDLQRDPDGYQITYHTSGS